MHHPLDHMLRTEAETLDSLPLQTSRISAGKYAVKSTKEKQVPREGEVMGGDSVRADIWFQTGPLSIDTIQRIRGLKIFAETHDQGRCDNPAEGNWTWVELAILEKESDRSPRKVDDIELVWYDHSIRHDEESEAEAGSYKWRHGSVFRKNHKILRFLEEGNCIAVRLCARFAGWQISGRTGYLVIDIDNDAIPRKPMKLSHVKEIVEKVEMMHNALSSVNTATQAAFEPPPPPIERSLKRVDSVIGWQGSLRVLCFDGGGVRGYSSLLILRDLMAKIGNPKPCDVFHMIGGTSTGGLIAIMLGRLEMDVEECIIHYKKDMMKIFGDRERQIWLEKKAREAKQKANFVFKGRSYDAKPLEDTVRDLVSKKLGNAEAKLLDDNCKCKVFVMAFDKKKANNRGPVYLRSYTSEAISFPDIKVWEAARATSAAPTYFDPMKVVDTSSEKKPVYELIDGGLGANNPLGWLWNEVVRLFGPTQPTNCFLSIGTCIPANEMLVDLGGVNWRPSNVKKFVGALSNMATNTQITHILFGTLIDSLAPVTGKPKKYWRLNVGQHGQDEEPDEAYLKDLQLPEMDDSGQIRTIEEMTNKYITKWQSDFQDCAQALVREDSFQE